MSFLEIVQNQYLSILFGGLAGVGTAWLTQRVLNKRGVFSYFVNHQKLGMTADDAVFGSVAVTWNGNPIQHLYLSTIELKNESLNDYEEVFVKAFSNDTALLSERTQILDTPNMIFWSDRYQRKLTVAPGDQPSDYQKNLHSSEREYFLPVLNRGQRVQITYLNSGKTDAMPHIWLDVPIKGVKLKFRPPQNQVFGVPQPRAALVGGLIGLLVVFPLMILIDITWLSALLSLIYGVAVLVPGAYTLKAIRKVREAIGG
ncbi:hypothetical protein LL273_17140 [Marinobacter salarius]|uniref:hypothetical protein n=1 Tax=Marinobacter salarius TaxID=1420917 RepID=UPI001D190998|nr:hypothetical protein [Marinobacter salarius]MCC4285446.1 hypothetical protein [Marinobacter salarius]